MANAAVYPVEHPFTAETEHPDVGPREVRSTDVSRISLTAPMAVSLAVAVAVIVGAFWQIRGADNTQVNSQLAAINLAVAQMATNIAAQRDVTAANQRADAVVIDNLKQSVDELKRQTQLLQLQYAEMSKQMRR